MVSKDIYTKIVEEYMYSVFGKTIGQNLFEIAQKKEGIVFEELDEPTKFSFLNTMLNSIYDGFYPKQKIQLIVVNLFFKFARYRIADKVEATLKQAVEVAEPEFTYDTYDHRGQIEKYLSVELPLYMEVSGLAEGGIILSIKHDAVELMSKYMAEANGMPTPTNAEERTIIVKEFYNIIAPGIIDVLANNFGETLYFIFIEQEEFIKKYTVPKEDHLIEMISTPFSWIIDERNVVCDIVFMRQNNSAEVKHLIEKKKRKDKEAIFNAKTPQITATYSENVHDNCRNFLLYVFESRADYILETTLEKLGRKLTPDLLAVDAAGFIKILTGHFMKKEIETKIAYVRANLEVILGIDENE